MFIGRRCLLTRLEKAHQVWKEVSATESWRGWCSQGLRLASDWMEKMAWGGGSASVFTVSPSLTSVRSTETDLPQVSFVCAVFDSWFTHHDILQWVLRHCFMAFLLLLHIQIVRWAKLAMCSRWWVKHSEVLRLELRTEMHAAGKISQPQQP